MAMRPLLALLLVLAAATIVGADDQHGHRHGVTTDLFVDVPLDYDTSVVFPFGGSHHAVRGVATINQAPYYCRPHDMSFEDRAAFVEHLSVKHGLTDREIPRLV